MKIATDWKRTCVSRLLALALSLGAVGTSVASPARYLPELQLKLLEIPAGKFLAGSPATEPGRGTNEDPRTEITLTHPFWLGQYEVTQGQWKKMMGRDQAAQARLAHADETRYWISGKEWLLLREFAGIEKDGDPLRMIGNTDDNVPMILVSWDEAQEFCRKLTASERAAGRVPDGYEYRLPTEAEWEYACRAGTTTTTYAGDMEIHGHTRAPVLDDIAWHAGNSSRGYAGRGIDTVKFSEGKKENAGVAGPRQVGTKKSNAWGLYDMLGNVGEWCLDWDGLWPGGSVQDWQGPLRGTSHVRRGGGWSSSAHGVRAAYRNWHEPTYRWINLGFRVALGPIATAGSTGSAK